MRDQKQKLNLMHLQDCCTWFAYLQQNQKRARAKGKKCHAKTMMSRKTDEVLK